MKKQKQLCRLLTFALAVMTLSGPALADSVGGAAVHTSDSGLNLRAEATTLSTALTTIPNGTFLLVEDCLDGWYQVSYDGQSGYVSADYADFAETLEGEYSFAAKTLGTDINLRAGAGTEFDVLRRLAESGSALTVRGVSGAWLQVQDDQGNVGYVRSDLVQYRAEAAAAEAVVETSQAALSTGEQLAESARQYIGCRYIWGGMSPDKGFDCSGLANYVYSLYGYSLHRVAQDMYNNDGVAVSWNDKQPGDLLFFGYGPGSVTHVGIYVGEGQMVHASTSSTGVILTDVSSSNYYNRMYVGAKRIVS